MIADNDAFLEAQLRAYGLRERQILDGIPLFSTAMKAAFQSGNDQLGIEYEKAILNMKQELIALAPLIAATENTLYGSRTRKKT